MPTQGVQASRMVMVAVAVCAVCFIMTGPVAAQGTWVEELGNFVEFYPTIHPGLDWTPYVEN